jgi:hypothetical protein
LNHINKKHENSDTVRILPFGERALMKRKKHHHFWHQHYGMKIQRMWRGSIIIRNSTICAPTHGKGDQLYQRVDDGLLS